MPKAIICNSFNGLEALTLQEVPEPVLQPDEVLIAVDYAGVNYPDTLIIQGKYQFQPELPFSPGQEVSGTVLAIGDQAQEVRVGDAVLASMTWGGFGEVVKAHWHNVYQLPPKITCLSAAVVLETYGTAIHALKDRGQLHPGETLVVLGASGGTGTAAVQLGKVLGAKVIAVCSSEAKRKEALDNGADLAVPYDNLKSQLKEHHVDVVFDPVGGEVSEQAFRSLRPNGRHLVVGFASGEVPALPWNLPLLKSASIVGVFWGSFWRTNPKENRANMRMILKWMSEGKLKVRISKTYPLVDAAKALDDIMSRRAMGKLVLEVKS
ncbi:NADPH:quinone oxidoreductase family protein [Marinoscillum sp.]|uniref:NADPH:quinone oxidoreductase family protein n=1 Tax=Marinoscillum sp. TaxID=2024838 RepID=UPI003BA9EBB3